MTGGDRRKHTDGSAGCTRFPWFHEGRPRNGTTEASRDVIPISCFAGRVIFGVRAAPFVP